ncbi:MULTISPECIES: CaiB/BaiF CoA transferase family protein [Corynebacterium]|uniref:Formyl-CoA transferase n=1 Tax=Corynebacterium hadale TaxID=2026255 RepID=A0A269PBK1_9CORY|nr:CoA transferase [Corynebacterium hadale]PAJ69063.1 formyl-CoA transferase [Corynebacterium hadale]WKC61286.1 Succinyl-CoA:(R)-benzylsuccinate CoA-transferase subunit BbsF [Corynebacterium hadale]
MKLLEGVRVIELGNYIAAPTASRLLADFGAEVIKVERPQRGDELRKWRLYGGETSMLYRTINRNKKSITLDLKSEKDLDILRQLVADSDALIENFRPGTLEKWGIGPEQLQEVNPNLVIARISAYGQTGPLSPQPGFAAVAEAFSGFRNLVGDPDRAPVRVGVSIGDSIAGLYAAFGVVMQLLSLERQRPEDAKEPPEVVDVALHEAMFSMMESLIPDYSAFGKLRGRVGGRAEGIAPTNAYICKDGKSVVIAGNGDSIFQRYMRVIGRPDLAEDPLLENNAQRWDRRDELDRAIGGWTITKESHEVLQILDAEGVPAGPIFTAADIVSNEQYRARDMLQQFCVDIGEGEPTNVLFPGIVPVLNGKSEPIRNVGPDLGEHNQEILERYREKGSEDE